MAVNISILGSTGSIGTQTLEVARNLKLRVLALTANTQIDLLEKQAREFKPSLISVGSEDLARCLAGRLKDLDIEIVFGLEGLTRAATMDQVDTVVTSVVGIAGLIPTMAAIKSGKDIALANKETLVTAGEIVMLEAARKKVRIFPVDSEHSAIFQCLETHNKNIVRKIILTACGGPFRGKSYHELENITVEQALNHPNWHMGCKVTIDSATLMNKGLEMIEAKWLFGLTTDQIQVLVHPQSMIHSMVEYVDGSILAQLGPADMRIPIQFALSYPSREFNSFSRLDLLKSNLLTFEEPDYKSFACLRLASEAMKCGGTMPAAMNGANEVAVNLFLHKRISFLSIPIMIEKVMQKHNVNIRPGLNDIIEVDRWAREEANRWLTNLTL